SHRRWKDRLQHAAEWRHVIPPHPARQIHQRRRDQRSLIIDAQQSLDLWISCMGLNVGDVTERRAIILSKRHAHALADFDLLDERRRNRVIQRPIDTLLHRHGSKWTFVDESRSFGRLFRRFKQREAFHNSLPHSAAQWRKRKPSARLLRTRAARYGYCIAAAMVRQ